MQENAMAAGTQPNIVLIMSDQHNANVMGCAGNPIVRTPNLDALAGQGTRFTNVYCPYPLCAPSRMGFMAASYPSEVGVFDNGGILSSQTPTFAHALGAAGYETVLCGRMHFVGPDPFHGFEKRIHGDCGGRALSPEILGTGPNRTNGQTKYAVEVSGYGGTGYQRFDRSVTDTACDYISDWTGEGRPRCLVVGLMLPHNPLICSRTLFDRYMEQIPLPEPVSPDYLGALHPAMRKWRERRGVDQLTPDQNRRGLAAYYGLVTELDRNVGGIVNAVKSSTAAERTVIIYCSDHGDMACEHGMWWKSSFYDGSARVPLIVSWPPELPHGKNDAVISLIDVGPTVLDLAGTPLLPDVSGRSFAGFLRCEGTIPDWPHEVFSEYIGLLGDQPACMVRRGPWKLNYYHEFQSCQLFNMVEDPGEMHDRAEDPDCRGIVADCKDRIHARWSAERVLIDADKQNRARDLIRRCGHGPMPHPVSPFAASDGDNRFDFSQLAGNRP